MGRFAAMARSLLLVGAVWCGPMGASTRLPEALAGETPADQAAAVASTTNQKYRYLPRLTLLAPHGKDRDQFPVGSSDSFAGQRWIAPMNDLSAKWAELQSRILSERETLAACYADEGHCPAAARRFIAIIEIARQRQGRARLGEINRAVNLSIRPKSDWELYGVDDFWSSPLATFSIGAGDCEDYAIAKYVALRESGIAPDDISLVILRDLKRNINHAVVAVRQDQEWLILDNRTLVLVNVEEARHFEPLLVLDDHGARAVGTLAFRP